MVIDPFSKWLPDPGHCADEVRIRGGPCRTAILAGDQVAKFMLVEAHNHPAVDLLDVDGAASSRINTSSVTGHDDFKAAGLLPRCSSCNACDVLELEPARHQAGTLLEIFIARWCPGQPHQRSIDLSY
jgi:hypothetical protein